MQSLNCDTLIELVSIFHAHCVFYFHYKQKRIPRFRLQVKSRTNVPHLALEVLVLPFSTLVHFLGFVLGPVVPSTFVGASGSMFPPDVASGLDLGQVIFIHSLHIETLDLNSGGSIDRQCY